MKVVREDVFGPVAMTRPFAAIDDLARRLTASAVRAKCCKRLGQTTPFEGYKQYGWGRENGKEVLKNYLQTKAVYCQL